MKIYLHSLAIVSLFLMNSACTENNNQEVAPPNKLLELSELSGKTNVIGLVENNWNKVLSHCPGFNEYKDDLTFIGLDDMVDEI